MGTAASIINNTDASADALSGAVNTTNSSSSPPGGSPKPKNKENSEPDANIAVPERVAAAVQVLGSACKTLAMMAVNEGNDKAFILQHGRKAIAGLVDALTSSLGGSQDPRVVDAVTTLVATALHGLMDIAEDGKHAEATRIPSGCQ